MTDRPHNVRTARSTERTHNSRRYYAESRPEDTAGAARSYRGSHRVEHQHGADSWAHHRSSRVGRHHADRTSPW